MKILITISLMIVVWAVILVAKALMLKPTSAKTAKVILDESERATEYGKTLSKMVQKETVSSRFDPDRTKFYEFHALLEELFPILHERCEKHVFDGSLLFKWSGSGKEGPILLMSHHDVVEANGTWEHEPVSGEIDDFSFLASVS